MSVMTIHKAWGIGGGIDRLPILRLTEKLLENYCARHGGVAAEGEKSSCVTYTHPITHNFSTMKNQ